MINAARTDVDTTANTPKIAVSAQVKLQHSEKEISKPTSVEIAKATEQPAPVYNFVGIAG